MVIQIYEINWVTNLGLIPPPKKKKFGVQNIKFSVDLGPMRTLRLITNLLNETTYRTRATLSQ